MTMRSRQLIPKEVYVPERIRDSADKLKKAGENDISGFSSLKF